MKLTSKLIRDIFIFLIIITAPVYYLAYCYSLSTQTNNREFLINKQLINFQSTLSEALWNGDTPYVRQIINTLRHTEGVAVVHLLDESEKIVKDFELPVSISNPKATTDTPESNYKFFNVELTKNSSSSNEKLGYLRVKMEFDDLRQQAKINSISIIVFFLFAFIVLFLFQYLYLRKFLIKPLSDLEQAIKAMGSNADIRLPENKKHIYEIASLTKTFNNMGEELKQSSVIINNQQMQMINFSKMSSLSEMASGVAHEINNPLMITSGFLNRIQKIVQSDPTKYGEISDFAEKAIKGTVRVAKIVKSLRSFARNANNDPMQTAEVNKILSETIELCLERFKFGEINLEIIQKANCNITCRESQISQVLLNLLNNAYDAVVELDIKNKWVQVEVIDSTQSNRIFIYITDCGSGISKEIADKILDPFFTTKGAGKGTGLGLSISAGIIEEHGGRLYLDHENKNTRFVIELPKHD